jgi:hypothetical protein
VDGGDPVIALACVLAYLTASLYGARHLYAQLRARAIDKRAAKTTILGPLYEDPVARFNEWDRTETAVGSILAAVFWPLTLTGYGAYRFVTANPALSRTELAAERNVMAERIRELEHELGIKEPT